MAAEADSADKLYYSRERRETTNKSHPPPPPSPPRNINDYNLAYGAPKAEDAVRIDGAGPPGPYDVRIHPGIQGNPTPAKLQTASAAWGRNGRRLHRHREVCGHDRL
ncbi:Cellulase [Zalerion maritima]|uniref:Cellulase n=1 Tax=Zalerion maritima TaxID=339359 RepID=A0AAD5WQQ8_9PEZI|nr:Cellulase [Zalerion maritima]